MNDPSTMCPLGMYTRACCGGPVFENPGMIYDILQWLPSSPLFPHRSLSHHPHLSDHPRAAYRYQSSFLQVWRGLRTRMSVFGVSSFHSFGQHYDHSVHARFASRHATGPQCDCFYVTHPLHTIPSIRWWRYVIPACPSIGLPISVIFT